jgi:hypothetical protein
MRSPLELLQALTEKLFAPKPEAPRPAPIAEPIDLGAQPCAQTISKLKLPHEQDPRSQPAEQSETFAEKCAREDERLADYVPPVLRTGFAQWGHGVVLFLQDPRTGARICERPLSRQETEMLSRRRF